MVPFSFQKAGGFPPPPPSNQTVQCTFDLLVTRPYNEIDSFQSLFSSGKEKQCVQQKDQQGLSGQ